MATYNNTPGVYVKEIPTLPASVAQVATAIPAFIGYTERADKNGTALAPRNTPTRISSMIEYEKYFGGPQFESEMTVIVDMDDEQNVRNIQLDPLYTFSPYVMYYQIQMYFANGGGPCYIVSAGSYEDPIAPGDAIAGTGLLGGLSALAMEDEPTLIVFPDAREIADETNFYDLYIQALDQCNTLQDRFTIVDLYGDGETAAETLRNFLASDYLKYGAAYYPDLQTSLSYAYRDSEVIISDIPGEYIIENKIRVLYHGPVTHNPQLVINLVPPADLGGNVATFEYTDYALTINIDNNNNTSVSALIPAWNSYSGEKGLFSIVSLDDMSQLIPGAGNDVDPATIPTDMVYPTSSTLENLAVYNSQLYNQVKAEIARQASVILSPSAAIAGVYARTDRDRGVWKAPANTPLANVIAPTVKITDAMQDTLNVDATSGKSVNAIRAFSGKGTLVWGARTLAGNDNEWRYVSTRRLFIMVEESIEKSTSWVVFQPNDARTWIKVKAQIENFLNGLWRDGALAGAKAEEAFFVNVGLGITMDSQDILEGRMNIEIGMAAVRPAEFIILKFSHKLQKA